MSGGVRRGSFAGFQQAPGDQQFLDLARSIKDSERTNVAIEPFDDFAFSDPRRSTAASHRAQGLENQARRPAIASLISFMGRQMDGVPAGKSRGELGMACFKQGPAHMWSSQDRCLASSHPLIRWIERPLFGAAR
jgi:hypothetical protein